MIFLRSEQLATLLWLAHSTNLMPSDYYLWESLKDKAFKINPPTKDRLKSLDMHHHFLHHNF
jgi:hypothetical protein